MRQLDTSIQSTNTQHREAPPARQSRAKKDTSVKVVQHALRVFPHQNRQEMIAEAAYHRAEARGFAPGHELEDWLAAEAEVDARVIGERAS